MPDLFRLVATDPLVTKYAAGATIVGPQTSTGFSFEFHGGHETGNPVYVRIAGNTDKSNVPKFDTLNKTAAKYPTYSSLANAGRLDKAKKEKDLKNTDLDEISRLIRDNFATFQQIARGYYAKG